MENKEVKNKLDVASENNEVKATEKGNKITRNTHPKLFYSIWLTTFLCVITAVITAGGWYYFGEKYLKVQATTIRLEEQLEFYKQKSAAQPKDANVLVDLGYTYSKLGDYDNAIQSLEKAKKLDKNNYNVYLNLGITYISAKNYDEATEALVKATKIAPIDYQGHLYLGIAYKELKMYDKASQSLGKANSMQPGSSTILFNIGEIAEESGDYKNAADIYKEALSYDPLYKDAIEALERVEKKIK
jgi:tetratricopeptide (TPR) repeat protein